MFEIKKKGAMTNNSKENGQNKVCNQREHWATCGPWGPPRHFFEITAGITTGKRRIKKWTFFEITAGITAGG